MAEERSTWAGCQVVVLSPTPTHPQDYGNRKRVHAVCCRLQAAGAAIHFVHYGSEVEWREGYPIEAQRAMVQAWNSYTQVAPTQPLHPAPARGLDHGTDEWWDPAIGDVLKWLFARVEPDLFIVNYTWLSRALLLAPGRALRVLDTHDRFSGRRELLAANGIPREFFHLDAAGEARALRRAHLIWAIKAEENAFFKRLVDREVVTLPHADPWRPLAPPPKDDERGVRLGIIGALNNLNLRNVEDFLAVALPIFKAHMAPLTLRIAGTMCLGLNHLAPDPFVELLGPIDDLDAFYRSLDAVLVPMAYSTGLKIKAGEALARGLPVLAHAHAFEGYRVHHPAQSLPSFEVLAMACVELAYAPKSLAAMRAAAAATQRSTEATVAAGLVATADALARHRPPILLLPGSGALATAWLAANRPFFAAIGEVTVELHRTNNISLQPLVDRAEVVVVGDVPATALEGIDWTRVDVHLVAALAGFDRPAGALERLAAVLCSARSFVLLAAEAAALDQAGAAKLARPAVPATLFGDDPPEMLRPSPERTGPPTLLVLATQAEAARGRAIVEDVVRAVPWADVTLACPLPLGASERGLRSTAAWLLGACRPSQALAVDLDPGAIGHAALREVLLRQGHRIMPAAPNAGAVSTALMAHLLRSRPPLAGPAYGRGNLDWLWHHLARRKRCGFAAIPTA